MRISDWGSDVCSSDLDDIARQQRRADRRADPLGSIKIIGMTELHGRVEKDSRRSAEIGEILGSRGDAETRRGSLEPIGPSVSRMLHPDATSEKRSHFAERSEEHTSELQSLMRISYAVFCLKKKTRKNNTIVRSKP